MLLTYLLFCTSAFGNCTYYVGAVFALETTGKALYNIHIYASFNLRMDPYYTIPLYIITEGAK